MKQVNLQPIFLCSLPRSGSTLLQRILASHVDISTTSEPWFLLPLVSSIANREGVFANYSQKTAVNAIADFSQELPNGLDDYRAEIQKFAISLYEKAAEETAVYFLDKTPRYHLIVEEIIKLFPNGKFIFLWRNPLSIVSSIVETWMNGKWHIHRYKVDLYEGLANLTATYAQHQGNVHSLTYESLIDEPQKQIQAICTFLDLEYDEAVLESFTKIRLGGRYGDPTGVNLYSTINENPLNKWMQTLKNPLRRTWCIHYLKWIGTERLSLMGYDLDNLLSELSSVPFSLTKIHVDLITSVYGTFYSFMEPQIIKLKLKNFSQWHEIYAHA